VSKKVHFCLTSYILAIQINTKHKRSLPADSAPDKSGNVVCATVQVEVEQRRA